MIPWWRELFGFGAGWLCTVGSPRFAYAKRDGGLSISTDEKLRPSEAGETDGRLDAGQRAVGSFLFL